MKSMLGVALAQGLANGNWPCGGFSIGKAEKVAYVSWEDGEDRIARRYMRGDTQLGGKNIPDFFPSERSPLCKLPRHEKEMIEWIRGKGYSVVFIDTTGYLFEVEDENSAAEMQRFAASCRRVVNAANCGLVLVHHSNKGARDKKLIQDRARGSSTLMGLADVVVELSRVQDGDLSLEVVPKDAPPCLFTVSYSPALDEPWAVAQTEGEKAKGGVSPAVERTRVRIVEAVIRLTASGKEVDQDLLANETGLSTRTLREHLPVLAAAGRIRVSPGGGRGNATLYTAPEQKPGN
jgi:hypothetical protein